MIRRIDEMPFLLTRLLGDVETEIVEFKEAKQSFDSEDLGKYFSALSNEANFRNAECGWLIFGVTDNREICGTPYRKEASIPSVGLRRLKRSIAEHLSGGMTFEEIYEFDFNGKRIVAFQIPPATYATPTTWRENPWSRENESLVPMPQFKIESLLGQSRPDWSRQIAYEATIEDLDEAAASFACKKYREKHSSSQPIVEDMTDDELLRKIGLIVHEHITNAALVLLGKPESVVFLGGTEPRITWTLYASDGATIAYEHFEPPFILQVDKVLGKIRNEKYRYFERDDTLFPAEGFRYTPEVIRELLHNAIAHQDFRMSGKINVLEYEDRLIFKNEGAFIPGTIQAALENGYKPPYYRNPLLSSVMSKTGMMDRNAIGIRNVFDIQRNRLLPLPTYDLANPRRVSVTVYGRVLNEGYSRLLSLEPNLEIDAVFLLDMVQKGLPITKEQAKLLRERGLIEGRYPSLIITRKVAGAIGAHAKRLRARGVDNRVTKELIVELLKSGPFSRAEIISSVQHALPGDLTNKQKADHVSYLLRALRKEGRIESRGATSSARWFLTEDNAD